MKESKVKGYISAKKDDFFVENFKGEISDKLIKWPKELGVEHPFNFEDTENVFKKFGLLNGSINKIVNNIVGEFTINSEKPSVLKAITEFDKKNNLRVFLREWIKEGLIKGNGFIELDKQNKTIKVLNANNIYVVRDKKGIVKGYNQYIGDLEKFNQKKIIPFAPEQIAHLPINVISGDAYGIGIVWPNERVIENIILTSQDKIKLLGRKAGAPIHVKVGLPGESVNPSDIDLFKSSLQYMNNRTEWVTDANVEMNVLQFGEVGKNLEEEQNALIKELIAGIDMPEVLLNSGQLNEGIANVQLEGWQRTIRSYQDMIEPIIINKILKPLLGLEDDDIDFVWNLPGVSEVNARIEKLNATLGLMALSPNMRRMLELEIARLLNIQNAELYLPAPEEGLNEQREAEDQAMKQAENTPIPAGVKPKTPPQPRPTSSARESASIREFDYQSMDVKSFLELKEVKGLTYSDYLVSILKRLKVDKFEDLRAITESDIENGLLSEGDINKLRTILREGFRRNQTISQIESNIKENMVIRDRIKEDGSKIPAISRPEMIARTEVVRLSNEGLKDLYKENGVSNVIWTASMSDRTCEECMAKDGQIYPIQEAIGDNIPPLHVNCRCSLLAT
jgi:SPP1 gp7 family putative phage head morphogenesis protein